MTYFVTEKLAAMATAIATRADYAVQAQRATSENIYTLERIINAALPGAHRQLEEFEDYVGEPLPAHIHEAITTEIRYWQRLQESLAQYKDSEPNDHDAIMYAKNVRQFLTIQRDLLQLTEEMFASCLVEHYRSTLDALRHAASEVPL